MIAQLIESFVRGVGFGIGFVVVPLALMWSFRVVRIQFCVGENEDDGNPQL